MLYDEYLKSAHKHLQGCSALLTSYNLHKAYDNHVWLELYYLSGYIIEGIVVYSAYKLYNWVPNEDIQRKYNLAFSKRTNLDFYRKRSRIMNGVETCPPYFQNRPSGYMSVESHNFQEITKNLLKSNPSFNNIPYLGDGAIDDDIETLIDNWRPNIRYHYDLSTIRTPIDRNVIIRLLSTCYDIYQNHI